MREIKFRAWHRMLKEWHYFDLTDLIAGRAAEYKLWYENWGLFTNLKDKNGKEIYEGDIIKDNDNPEHAPTLIGWYDWTHDIEVRMVGLSFPWVRSNNTLEVIGNIYENPELLK